MSLADLAGRVSMPGWPNLHPRVHPRRISTVSMSCTVCTNKGHKANLLEGVGCAHVPPRPRRNTLSIRKHRAAKPKRCRKNIWLNPFSFLWARPERTSLTKHRSAKSAVKTNFPVFPGSPLTSVISSRQHTQLEKGSVHEMPWLGGAVVAHSHSNFNPGWAQAQLTLYMWEDPGSNPGQANTSSAVFAQHHHLLTTGDSSHGILFNNSFGPQLLLIVSCSCYSCFSFLSFAST